VRAEAYGAVRVQQQLCYPPRTPHNNAMVCCSVRCSVCCNVCASTVEFYSTTHTKLSTTLGCVVAHVALCVAVCVAECVALCDAVFLPCALQSVLQVYCMLCTATHNVLAAANCAVPPTPQHTSTQTLSFSLFLSLSHTCTQMLCWLCTKSVQPAPQYCVTRLRAHTLRYTHTKTHTL